jgi:hypothetical protein
MLGSPWKAAARCGLILNNNKIGPLFKTGETLYKTGENTGAAAGNKKRGRIFSPALSFFEPLT